MTHKRDWIYSKQRLFITWSMTITGVKFLSLSTCVSGKIVYL